MDIGKSKEEKAGRKIKEQSATLKEVTNNIPLKLIPFLFGVMNVTGT